MHQVLPDRPLSSSPSRALWRRPKNPRQSLERRVSVIAFFEASSSSRDQVRIPQNIQTKLMKKTSYIFRLEE